MQFFFKIILVSFFLAGYLLAGPADTIINNKKESFHIILKLIHTNDTKGLLKEIQNGLDISKPINENNMSPLLASIILNHFEITKILLNHGATPNEVHSSGMTPLLYAIKLNNLDTIALLIKKGVNINQHSKDSNVTPLIYATKLGNISIISLLLKHGANINIQDKNGYKAYHYAKAYHNKEIINLILNSKENNDKK